MSTARAGVGALSLLDNLLRGRVAAGERAQLLVPLVLLQIIGAAAFGLSLGCYALSNGDSIDMRYLGANLIKLPLLLLLTSLVTCPSLYVFGAIKGLRFSPKEIVAMLFATHTILAAVLGSFAPVVAFFSFTTTNYSFMVLLTVGTCVLAGILGLRTFMGAVREPDPLAPTETPELEVIETDVDSKERGKNVRTKSKGDGAWQVLGWWLALYVFVGAQMAWILRPFLGSPELEFVFFRGKESSFIEAFFQHLSRFVTG